MKLNTTASKFWLVIWMLFASACGGTVARAQSKPPVPPTPPTHETKSDRAAQSIAADERVTVTLCADAGSVVVRGWDRREVRARGGAGGRLELRRVGAKDPAQFASRIEVRGVDDARDEDADEPLPPCLDSGNLELDVPRGGTVRIMSRDSDVSVMDVADVRAETLSGDVDLRRINGSAEATSANGDLALTDSRGRVRLRTISGTIEASNDAPVDAADEFYAKSTSGDVNLERIGHAHVEAATTSGEVSWGGALVRGGAYDFKTIGGSVTLSLPAATAFRLNAHVYQGGEIITDFPVRHIAGPNSGSLLAAGRLIGLAGAGDGAGDPDMPSLNLSSFSGTLYLRRQK